MRMVLVYEVNTMELGDTVLTLPWVSRERFILIDGDHSFSRRELNGQTGWLDALDPSHLPKFRSRNLVHKMRKYAVILFNCM